MRNSSPVVLGEIIADKYQVEGVIGEGGMGLVVSAWHLGLRQRVAIKLLLSDGGHIEDAALERFQREARAAARIRSEHVCRVLDVGMLAAGTPYLVMEYLEGCDLADELSRRGRLPAGEAIGYVLEACEALAEAHVAGIIHRDLKPANLFLAHRSNGTRCLKLLDFGVSKSMAGGSLAQLSLTKTSSIVGSPIYMSPEQLNSAKDVDARTDIWALGALTYELITGRPPFFGETIPQLVSQVLNSEPPTLAELGVTVPGGLEGAIRRALSKSRDRRYASVGEFATALGPFAPDDSISVSRILRIRASSDGRDPLPETLDDRSLSRRTPRSGRVPTPPAPTPATTARTEKSWRWAWIALLFIALAGVAAALSRRLGTAENQNELASPNVGNAVDAGEARPRVPALPELPTKNAALGAGSSAPPSTQPLVPAPLTSAAGDASVLGEPRFGGATQRAKPRPARPANVAGADSLPNVSNFGGRR